MPRQLSPRERKIVRAYFAQLSRERRAERAAAVREAKRAETVYYRLAGTPSEYEPPAPSFPNVSDAPNTRTKRKIIYRLVEAQSGRCYLCTRSFKDFDLRPTLEHVVPRVLGGKTACNVLAACFACNNEKADRPPTRDELRYLAQINKALGLTATALSAYIHQVAEGKAIKTLPVRHDHPTPPYRQMTHSEWWALEVQRRPSLAAL